MKPVDSDWLEHWMTTSAIQRSAAAWSYRRSANKYIEVITEKSTLPGKLILLADRVVWRNEPEGDNDIACLDAQDLTWVFWLRERDIWGDPGDAIAGAILRKLLAGSGIEKHPFGIVFETSEWQAACGFILIAILFGWDAYFFPLSSSYLCHISHDGYIAVSSADDGVIDSILERLREWDAKVKPAGI